MPSPATARLGHYIAALRDLRLPGEVREKAACCLIDALSLAVAAADEPTTRAFLGVISRREPGPGGCRVWADGTTASLADAVAANALATHARFQDDCDMASWSHPGSLVVPAVVTAGEWAGASADQVLRAIVAGYTVINWLGGAGVIGHAMVERGFRTSPTIGPVGAAAGASLVLGLSAGEAANAVAIVAGIAGGVVDTVRAGSADFRLQNAHAAWAGLNAALLARGGVLGSAGIFESPQGFLACYAGLPQPVSLDGAPSPEAILDSWSKPYPTLGDNVAVVAAALTLHAKHEPDAAAITAIRVHQNAQFASYPGTAFRGPYLRPTQAIASTAYAVAATLAYGRLRYDRYLHQLDDRVVTSLIERLHVVPEPAYGFLDGMVEVELASGECLVGRASDLPRETFHRNRQSATEALDVLLAEKQLAAASAQELAEGIFAAASGGPEARQQAGTLLDSAFTRFFPATAARASKETS